MTVAEREANASGPAPRALGIIWALLLVNSLGTSPVNTIVPVPRVVSQIVTMGALGIALLLALVINPRIRIRTSAFLLLLTLLVVVSVAASFKMESGTGSLIRCARYAAFVATLWLVTPWWRGDLRFALYHLRILSAFLVTVAVGMVIAPGSAFSGPDGRLVGAIWPITAPQVGLYCAVATGLSVILWVTGKIDGRSTAVIAVPAVGLLLLSHTRTALLGLVVSLLLAGLSLVTVDSRVRRALTIAIGGGLVAWLVFAGIIQTFLLRGQDAEQLSSLSGRAKVWDLLLAKHRTLSEQLIGVGLTDKSFAGRPIDNSWLSIYNEQGVVGVGLVVAFVLCLVVLVILRPPSPQRACALFLVAYCLIASYTEVGLGDASPYQLNLALAASLLVGAGAGRDRTRSAAPVFSRRGPARFR